MSFTSWIFLVFVFVSLIIYYCIPGNFQWVALLVFSYAFYLSGGVAAAVYLVLSTLVAYTSGLLLERINTKSGDLTSGDAGNCVVARRQKKLVVTAAVLVYLISLCVLKYGSWIASFVNSVFARELEFESIVPLGLSFFTLQAVSYVVDCYRGKCASEKNFFKFALFLSFFPQMTQGPIGRFGDLSPQLLKHRRLNADRIKYGMQLVMWGYFKKLVISGRAAVIADSVFSDYTGYHGVLLFLGVLFYYVQLYCDFSGGIDIAQGVSQMFGIDLAENFRRPFFATSLSDYWRRWHITLGQWMRDYIFYPLTLSKIFVKLGGWSKKAFKGRAGRLLPTFLATFIVYILVGVWHGSGMYYVLYGVYNAIIITVSQLLSPCFRSAIEKLHVNSISTLWKLFQRVRTLMLVLLGVYLVRSQEFGTALWMLLQTVRDVDFSALWDGRVFALGLTGFDMTVVILGMLIILSIETHQEHGGHVRAELECRSMLVQWLCFTGLLLTIFFLGVLHAEYVSPTFIYQNY